MPTKFAMRLLAGTAVSALITGASFAADAQARPFDIPQQDAATALQAFAMQSGKQVLFPYEAAKGKPAPAIQGDFSDEEVLALLAASAGLRVTADDGRTITLRPQFAQGASGGGGGTTVEALIVTAQKREEDIQDVPIAISAFSQEDLTRSQIAGGPDLMTQVPNFTFTKTNFSSYSIQIRGIGTQAISATTDAAVAVAFNNTPFIRNRFFEQEFYDLQRVEVLRGPQGTLYGRNATAGVVNIISAKPSFGYEARLSGDIANYNSTRIEGMLNMPLVEDMVAVRLAGAWTKREGFVTNRITGTPIDGRDLWSTRLSLRFSPTDRIDANLIWEHFEEDDDRLRSGKQLCKKHVVTEIDGIPVNYLGGIGTPQTSFSQGCEAASLYSPDSFQTPNGWSLPYYHPLGAIFVPAVNGLDPYLSTTQSRDLRVIESTVDPHYGAETDVVELQFDFDLTENLTLTSETGYLSDTLFSTQDFNRFNTAPGAFDQEEYDFFVDPREAVAPNVLNDGVFCDPQVGCADRLVAVDLSTADSHHFSQELRLASDYEGPFNFSLGANFLRYDTEDKYYVFINTLTMYAALNPYGTGDDQPPPYMPGVTDNRECLPRGFALPDPNQPYDVTGCVYIDPNPIGSLNDLGHNYFLSRNPYKLISYAVFGEAYYNFTDALKITAGLRWTVDKKEAPRIPSWVLAASKTGGSAAGSGYTVAEVIEQEWREPTGRLTIDWKPRSPFTDETLLYASFAHGYKAGGANPPTNGLVLYSIAGKRDFNSGYLEESATHPKTFEPEFVDAYEIGTKNTLLDGAVTINAAAFYYDYTGYQISQIVDRSALNLNFDADVWGVEIEADWRPLENLRLGFKGGYENTRVADGSKAIDLMDRTAGRDDWVVARPFPTLPSNCVLPISVVNQNGVIDLPGQPQGGNLSGCELAYILNVDPLTGLPYVPNPTVREPGFFIYPGYEGFDPATAPNGGAGFDKDLSGNELPNAPNFTATITADYTVPLPQDWLMTLHTDLYYQSEAWTRIFNTEGYDKLKAYTNVNLAAIFTNDDAGWKVMAYVKNVMDRDSITGAFLLSDDTALVTNVFLTEPRLYGLRVTKEWSGGPWWTGVNLGHAGPYPLTVEVGGQVQRHDAPYETLGPAFIDSFSAAIDPTTAQNRDLDWGDGREVRLVYRSPDSPWRIAAAFRSGRTNGASNNVHLEEIAGPNACVWLMSGRLGPPLCDPDFVKYGYEAGHHYNPEAVVTPINWSDAAAVERESYTVVDFTVGRDVGLGGLGKSSLNAGLRYGSFQSKTATRMDGIPNWYIPDGLYKYQASHSRYTAEFDADRKFEGVGPELSWEAAARLSGDDETGHVDLDWTVTGGVLFGKQKTRIGGFERSLYEASYYRGTQLGGRNLPDVIIDTGAVPVDIRRSTSATVPMLDVSLGISYEIQRIKVGAGYRWERYFDAIDAGFSEHREYDRTIDGPYFKIAVGFGG